MPPLLVRLLIATAGLNIAAFFLSRALLDGADPEGWWNFLPALVWYFTLPLFAALAVSAAGLYIAKKGV